MKVVASDGGVRSSAVPATQAEMEAATSTTLAVTPGRTHYHPGVAKAWVNFNGSGTLAVRGSYNVSSVTDEGTGDYTINWDTDFSNTNYAMVLGANDGPVAGATAHAVGYIDAGGWSGTYATTHTRVRFILISNSAVLADPEYVIAMALGDQ